MATEKGGLEIITQDKPIGIQSDRALYLKADKWTVVEQGDPAAAYGLVQAGGLISAEDVNRLHLSVSGGKVKQASRAEAYKAAGMEAPLPAEAPTAQMLVRPTPPPPPPPPEAGNSGATPQTPPSAPAAVPADAKGRATERQTVEEKVRLQERAERMSSGDLTTPIPDEGEPLRASPDAEESSTARKSTARKAGAKKATAKKSGAKKRSE